jgi:hypothetical protein
MFNRDIVSWLQRFGLVEPGAGHISILVDTGWRVE